MKPGEIRFSLQRPLQHRDPAMAPTITATMTTSQEHLTLTHKLRKPLVEKLRRERINSSIEQLKSLLGPDFLKQQPDSKLEKADILEMTVCVLRRLQQQHQQQSRLLNHINKLQSSSDNNLTEAFFLSSELHSPDQHHQRQESRQQRPLEAVVDTNSLELLPHKLT